MLLSMAYGSQAVISLTLLMLIKHVERQLKGMNISSDTVFPPVSLIYFFERIQIEEINRPQQCKCQNIWPMLQVLC